ncbi:hypothetical protein ADN00_07305 [Ornatilinea apprima]|uniref:Uncharacterized protein n=1 Tax=Ornatilinea apprima TaxID=1134406 RepID=A0A0P6XDE5_9CHLR|nr:hypothetical protein [Ornatilinea apprima]KPL78267.1 hypothetical protein ADN00_07305 [Ornatilinea apprima]
MASDNPSTEDEWIEDSNSSFDMLDPQPLIDDHDSDSENPYQIPDEEPAFRAGFEWQEEDSPQVAPPVVENPLKRAFKSLTNLLFKDTEDIGRQSSPSTLSIEEINSTPDAGFEQHAEDEETLDRLSSSVQIPASSSETDFWNMKRKTGQLTLEDTPLDDAGIPISEMQRRLTGELPDVEDLPAVSSQASDSGVPQGDDLRQFLAQLESESAPEQPPSPLPASRWGQIEPPAAVPFRQPEPNEAESDVDDLLFGTALRFGNVPDFSEEHADLHQPSEEASNPYAVDDDLTDSTVFLSDAETIPPEPFKEDEQDDPGSRLRDLRSHFGSADSSEESAEDLFGFFPGELQSHSPVFSFLEEEPQPADSAPKEEQDDYYPPFAGDEDAKDNFFDNIRRRALFEPEEEPASVFNQYVEDQPPGFAEPPVNDEPTLYFYPEQEESPSPLDLEMDTRQFLMGDQTAHQNTTRFLEDLAAADREDAPQIQPEEIKVSEIKPKHGLGRIDLNSREFLIVAASLVGIIIIAVATILLTRNLTQIRLPVFSLPAAAQADGVYPVGMKLPGGWYFDLQPSYMENGEWKPQAAEWLEGSAIRRVIAVPWNAQTEAVVKTFTTDDKIQLFMSNEDIFAYRVSEVKQVPEDDTSVLTATKPSIVIILYQPKAQQRWVVIAEQ